MQRLVVLLGGARVGYVDRDARASLTFTYDEHWRDRPSATPLSLSMPMTDPVHRDPVVSAFLWGLLPDNDRVLQRWGRRFGVSARNAFSLLSSPVGEDCPGALQVVPEDRVAGAAADQAVEWLTSDAVAARLRELRDDSTSWLPASTVGQFSLAGAQAKTALLYDDKNERWGLPSGSMPTTHILKPAIHGLDDHDLNEHLCLAAIRRVGIPAVETSVQTFDDISAIAIRRYDRLRRDDAWLRLHQEDLCQALGVPPTAKYQNEGGPTPRQIVDLLRTHVRPATIAEREVWRFVDALALSWLLAGTDAHAKNYSVLLAGGRVRLAPLYDVASVLPYDEIDVLSQKLAMKIGGEYRLRIIGVQNWRKLADELDIDATRLLDRMKSLCDRVPDALADVSRTPAVLDIGSVLPGRLVDRVAARVGEIRGRL